MKKMSARGRFGSGRKKASTNKVTKIALILAILFLSGIVFWRIYIVNFYLPQIKATDKVVEPMVCGDGGRASQANVDFFSNYPVHGISYSISGGKFGDGESDMQKKFVADKTERDRAINFYKENNFNVAGINYENLSDSSGTITNEAKIFLKDFSDKKIRMLINFGGFLGNLENDSVCQSVCNTSCDVGSCKDKVLKNKVEPKIGKFISSLSDLKKNSPDIYGNILGYVMGGEATLTNRAPYVGALSCFFRSEYFKNSAAEIDKPLMVNIGDVNIKTVSYLQNVIDIFDTQNYPLIRPDKKDNKYISLSDHLNNHKAEIGNLNLAGGIDKRFYAQLQSHDQEFSRTIFFNTDDYVSESAGAQEDDPFPSGMQTGAMIYESLMSNTSHYLTYSGGEYLNSGANGYSDDRVKSIALANKLVDILWEDFERNPILKNSSRTDVSLSDGSDYFSGKALKFSYKNIPMALAIVDFKRPDFIFGLGGDLNQIKGNSGAKGPFDDIDFTISPKDLGMSGYQNIKLYQIDFPAISNVEENKVPKIGTSNSDTGLNFRVKRLNGYAIILLTYDNETGNGLVNYLDGQLNGYKNTAASMACKIRQIEAQKTIKQIEKIKEAGYALGNDFDFTRKLLDSYQKADCSKGYKDDRASLMQIAAMQINLRNKILGISDNDNLYTQYPTKDYNNKFWSCNEKGGAGCYRDFYLSELESCSAQRMHFYTLDKYVRDCYPKSDFIYLKDIDSARSSNGKKSSISLNTNKELDDGWMGKVEYWYAEKSKESTQWEAMKKGKSFNFDLSGLNPDKKNYFFKIYIKNKSGSRQYESGEYKMKYEVVSKDNQVFNIMKDTVSYAAKCLKEEKDPARRLNAMTSDDNGNFSPICSVGSDYPKWSDLTTDIGWMVTGLTPKRLNRQMLVEVPGKNVQGWYWCTVGKSYTSHPVEPNSCGYYKDGNAEDGSGDGNAPCGGDRATGSFCYALQNKDKFIWCTEKGCQKEGF